MSGPNLYGTEYKAEDWPHGLRCMATAFDSLVGYMENDRGEVLEDDRELLARFAALDSRAGGQP